MPDVDRAYWVSTYPQWRELAGKLLRLEQIDDGRLLLTPVVDVPESQLWTLREPHKSRIERGLAWAAATPAKETAVAAVVSKAKRRKNR
jgi:chromosomal replication initiation ATPase DnaA